MDLPAPWTRLAKRAHMEQGRIAIVDRIWNHLVWEDACPVSRLTKRFALHKSLWRAEGVLSQH
jgi:hypothetical protein